MKPRIRKKEYKDYVKEIEELTKKHNFKIDQVLLLQIASAFKVDNTDYNKLKRKFINENKKI